MSGDEQTPGGPEGGADDEAPAERASPLLERLARRDRSVGPPDSRLGGGRRGWPVRRSPIFAVLALGLASWLLWGLWPDVAYFSSPQDPIDLGGPGAYHLDAAQENRLVHVRGKLVDAVPVYVGGVVGKTGTLRTVGRIAGTNLLVDKPGPAGTLDLFEGRLLPLARRDTYGEVVQAMRGRGAPLGDRWLVLRDGERPRRGWLPVLGAALLVLILTVNLRALVRSLFSTHALHQERR